LDPGESVVVTLLFDCSVSVSFDAEVTVTATDPLGRSQTNTLAVGVQVTR
jgi:hypothetical protein